MQSDAAVWCRAAAGAGRAVLPLLLAGLLAACGDAVADGKGEGMFGFLKGSKPAAAPTRVAPELGATLQRQAAFPSLPAPAAAATAGARQCSEAAIRGQAPAAQIVEQFLPGETVLGFRVAAQGTLPALALFEVPGRQRRFEVWELSAGASPSFLKQRPVDLGPEQARWASFHLAAAVCLPGPWMALAVHYADPLPKDALYLYDTAAGAFRALGPLEPDRSVLPARYLHLLPAGPGSALLRWGSESVRVAPEVYARGRERLMLFTPRHPQGLEVLDLALADGNVRRWGLVGKTLWLETADPRQRGGAGAFVWSLDLGRVLP